MKKSIFLIISVVFLFSASTALAVDRLVPLAYPTIQDAINDCNDGDTVTVAPGNYTGPGNCDIDFSGKAITVRSTNPEDPCVVAATVIDCNGSPNEPHRGFYFQNEEDANSVLAGLTITNGYAYDGGGILSDASSSPKITDCVITGNTAEDSGGGIYGYDSKLTITNCDISRNTAGAAGGGLFRCSGPITNCNISGNSAVSGGGVGASAVSSFDGQMTNCTITDNIASAAYGGGVFVFYGSISNCVISGNTAKQDGGGIMHTDGQITNCTIVGNSSDTTAGGVGYCYSQITNCIIWNNAAPIDPQIWSNDFDPGPNYSCIQDFNGGGVGNINSDPCFVDSGYWADANDPNIIVEPNDPNAVWVEGDYHLLATSPCYNTGDPNFAPAPDETDIDGQPRVMEGRVDMGADEFEVIRCMAATNPDYANWLYWNKPDCWCYPRQCRGDADGEKLGPLWVSGNDLTILRNALSKLESDLPLGGICADFDHTKLGPFWVSGNDLAILRLYVSKLEEDVPVCGDPPDENFNFWTGPEQESTLEYEISPCDMGLLAAGQLDGTRFTATVIGRYISFEDMMTANCCATQLWLEMNITENLIKIYEHEAGGFCLCICDYPVTATIGPFTPGTYTIEVYEDWGGFIGSTIVYIE